MNATQSQILGSISAEEEVYFVCKRTLDYAAARHAAMQISLLCRQLELSQQTAEDGTKREEAV